MNNFKSYKKWVNEKFTQESDPVHDLGVGIDTAIDKWVKTTNAYKRGDISTKEDYLIICAAHNRTDFVKHLLNKGANVHADNDVALRHTSEYGYDIVVKLLLDAGANVHAGDDYALRTASYHGHDKVVKLLLDAGADIHSYDDYSLRWASVNGYDKVVKVLLDAGANVHARNDEPLLMTKYSGNDKVIKILRDHIAKEKKVKESLNEKFAEDTDPITDMGIGPSEQFKKLFDLFAKEDKRKYIYTIAPYDGKHIDFWFSDPTIRKLTKKQRDNLFDYVNNIVNKKLGLGRILVNPILILGYYDKDEFDPDKGSMPMIVRFEIHDEFRNILERGEYRRVEPFRNNIKYYSSVTLSSYERDVEIRTYKKQKSMNEKFTQESDPIEDLRIGYGQWRNLTLGDAIVCMHDVTIEDINFQKINIKEDSWCFVSKLPKIDDEILEISVIPFVHKPIIKNVVQSCKSGVGYGRWSLRDKVSKFYKNFRIIKVEEMLKESLNEKFKEDSDPIDDMDVGYAFLNKLNYGTIIKVIKRLYTLESEETYNTYTIDYAGSSGWFSPNWYGVVISKKVKDNNIILKTQSYAENIEDAKKMQQDVLDKNFKSNICIINIPLDRFKEHFKIIE